MEQGWIKLHRELLKNPIATRPEWAWLWCVLLLKANHKPKKWMYDSGIILIKEGQFVTSRDQLAECSGLSPSTVERILKYLENGQQIEQQKTTKFRLITIVNWEKYQTKRTAKRTASGQPMDTNKNDKNVKNIDHSAQSALNGVNQFINLFKEINPTTERLYSRPQQRQAAERLLQLHPIEWWQKFIEAYATKIEDRFCPKATTPLQLEDKLGQITAYAARLKSPSVKVI